MISDPAALHYIFVKSGYRFPKQHERRVLSQLINGKGILWSDGRFLPTKPERGMVCVNFLKVKITNDTEK